MEDFYTMTMLISIATFALSGVMTPGPNNILLLSSGLTFGYRRTIPHMLGIMFGFTFMVVLVGLGMGMVLERFPMVFSIIKVISILYLLWFAYRIANNKGGYEVDNPRNRPFTFLQGAAFQWVNPKAWIMAIASLSIFVTSSEESMAQVMVVAGVFFFAGTLSTNSWTLGGVFLKRLIRDERSLRVFNITMAILLVGSIVPFMLG